MIGKDFSLMSDIWRMRLCVDVPLTRDLCLMHAVLTNIVGALDKPDIDNSIPLIIPL